jgi:hypothetical protein
VPIEVSVIIEEPAKMRGDALGADAAIGFGDLEGCGGAKYIGVAPDPARALAVLRKQSLMPK